MRNFKTRNQPHGFALMKAPLRRFFDAHLETALREMPPRVHALLETVPLVVEDHPSRQIMRKMRVRHRDGLCGLYSGIPLTDRSVEQSGLLSDVIHIYREGILAMAVDRFGAVDESELRRQIRLTILHELGHYHGLDEKELRELGY